MTRSSILALNQTLPDPSKPTRHIEIAGHAIQQYRDRIENLRGPKGTAEILRRLRSVNRWDQDDSGCTTIGPECRVMFNQNPPPYTNKWTAITVMPIGDNAVASAANRGVWQIRERTANPMPTAAQRTAKGRTAVVYSVGG